MMTINALGQAVLLVGFSQFFFYAMVLLMASREERKTELYKMFSAVWFAMLGAAIVLKWVIEQANTAPF